MSVEKVRTYLKQFNKDQDIIELDASTATVELAAAALGTQPARIAKTLSFKYQNSCILVVCAGDMKIDNALFKEEFGVKASMLKGEEVEALSGHAIGGVCPFAVAEDVLVCCDTSLKAYDTIYPACGSSHSCIKLTPDELFTYSAAKRWVTVCKPRN